MYRAGKRHLGSARVLHPVGEGLGKRLPFLPAGVLQVGDSIVPQQCGERRPVRPVGVQCVAQRQGIAGAFGHARPAGGGAEQLVPQKVTPALPGGRRVQHRKVGAFGVLCGGQRHATGVRIGLQGGQSGGVRVHRQRLRRGGGRRRGGGGNAGRALRGAAGQQTQRGHQRQNLFHGNYLNLHDSLLYRISCLFSRPVL